MNTSSPWFPQIIALISAAAGGFFGSGSAFLLEWRRRRNEDTENRYQKLFVAQYTLITQHNTLLMMKTQYLDQHRNDPQRSDKLVPVVLHPSELRVNIGEITFLANKGFVDTLNNIHIAESCYLNAVAALNLRNQKIHEFRDDPTVELQGFEQGTGKAIIKADPRKLRSIKSLTDGLYDSVDDAEAKYTALVPELRTAIKKLFPGKNAFKYIPNK